MSAEAERYAEEEKKRREEAEALTAADSLAYQAEKTLADFGDKLTDELKGRIESARRELREATGKRDAPLAKEKSTALEKLLKEAGAVIYAQTPQAGPYKEVVVPGKKVVDAEYKEAR